MKIQRKDYVVQCDVITTTTTITKHLVCVKCIRQGHKSSRVGKPGLQDVGNCDEKFQQLI